MRIFFDPEYYDVFKTRVIETYRKKKAGNYKKYRIFRLNSK